MRVPQPALRYDGSKMGGQIAQVLVAGAAWHDGQARLPCMYFVECATASDLLNHRAMHTSTLRWTEHVLCPHQPGAAMRWAAGQDLHQHAGASTPPNTSVRSVSVSWSVR